ncbi:hypothetical protein BHL54_28925, partial [Bacillus cereus]
CRKTIKNKTQIKTWIKWHREGKMYRFSSFVGKQSTLQKASKEGITGIENPKFKMQIDIFKKCHKIERSWLKKYLSM